MKTCPNCKAPCPDSIEFCVCGHKFTCIDSPFDFLKNVSDDGLTKKKMDEFMKGFRGEKNEASNN